MVTLELLPLPQSLAPIPPGQKVTISALKPIRPLPTAQVLPCTSSLSTSVALLTCPSGCQLESGCAPGTLQLPGPHCLFRCSTRPRPLEVLGSSPSSPLAMTAALQLAIYPAPHHPHYSLPSSSHHQLLDWLQDKFPCVHSGALQSNIAEQPNNLFKN